MLSYVPSTNPEPLVFSFSNANQIVINHDLGYKPMVQIILEDGTLIAEGLVTHTSDNQVNISFQIFTLRRDNPEIVLRAREDSPRNLYLEYITMQFLAPTNTFEGQVILNGTPSADNHAITKSYLEANAVVGIATDSANYAELVTVNGEKQLKLKPLTITDVSVDTSAASLSELG